MSGLVLLGLPQKTSQYSIILNAFPRLFDCFTYISWGPIWHICLILGVIQSIVHHTKLFSFIVCMPGQLHIPIHATHQVSRISHYPIQLPHSFSWFNVITFQTANYTNMKFMRVRDGFQGHTIRDDSYLTTPNY